MEESIGGIGQELAGVMDEIAETQTAFDSAATEAEESQAKLAELY